MRLRSAFPLLALAALMVAVPASAASATVTVKDFSFKSNPTVSPGDQVSWDNQDGFTHNATRTSFPTWQLTVDAGDTAGRTFQQAGAFGYKCTIHPSMTGTVKVRVKASPASGTPSTTFTITVATKAAAAGSTYVIQRKAPGGTFKAWKTTTAKSVTFKSSVKGTWSFRSKIVKTSSGTGSGFSPSASVTIN
jgi:plastocyanin